MKAKYIRVSTTEQNPSRQIDKRYKSYIDKCSGSIPFAERPEAKKLIADVENRTVDYIIVHSISRLGRNTVDILQTIEYFTKIGVCIEAEKEGFSTLNRNKSENTTAKMVISIMATLAEFEREMLLERHREGIAKAKERGAYAANGGRPSEEPDKFLMKEKNRRILKLLQKGASIREAAFRANSSIGLVQKVKKVGRELGMIEDILTLKDDIIKNQKELIETLTKEEKLRKYLEE